MTNSSINIADRATWWEKSAGELKAGHFDLNLYVKFLERYNSMTYEERCKKKN